jgi:hypothetical protein
MSLSPKQRIIMDELRTRETITLDRAVELVGKNLYANAHKHVGVTIARMINIGLLVRVKPGLFAKAKAPITQRLRGWWED